jgi:release factor glutamine methyltransferase
VSKDLQKLFKIQEVLKDVGYPDYQRIANEILEYHIKTDTPLENIFKDLKKDIPWEYICGYAEFNGLFFKVTKGTLIPRIETEQLVEKANDLLHSNTYRAIIDVGTGSGCIAISIAKQNPTQNIFATDISKEALNIAKENALNNDIKNIEFVNTDLIKDIEIQEPVLILANLPYIPTKQYEELDPCVLNFEPRLALDGGKSGLDLYEKLFNQIKEKKIQKATLICEIEPLTLDSFKELITGILENPEYDIIQDFQNLNRFVLISLS